MNVVEAVRWSRDGNAVDIIDQRALPSELIRLELRTPDEICDAIATLAVRGAPAIGIAAAMGLVCALALHLNISTDISTNTSRTELLVELERLAARIAAVRPTAVNLPWAMSRMRRVGLAASGDAAAVLAVLRAEATRILDEDRVMCERIGQNGVHLIGNGARVLTHCNAGALATGGIGTALAPIYIAARLGRKPHVYAGETRPLLQGSRLTAWELASSGIDVTIIGDSMAASLMARGAIDVVIVGADRIAANGDVANKIGTYGLAVIARHHAVPFYVAAPWSTVDLDTPAGGDIQIEQRAGGELTQLGYHSVASLGVDTYNPAFDVTPASLITGIITDRGLIPASALAQCRAIA